MHIEFLLEEPSMEAVLADLLPRSLPTDATFYLRVFDGKRDLLQKLPDRLKAYRAWIPEDWRIVVLVDEDREDCHQLKQQLEAAAQAAGLRTRNRAPGKQPFQVLNRLAIEELEAWFFGDVTALRTAYPKVPAGLASQARYRDPDAIAGGTWETLERVLQRARYYPAGLPKVETARRIASHLDPARNRSHSFQVFWSGLQEILT